MGNTPKVALPYRDRTYRDHSNTVFKGSLRTVFDGSLRSSANTPPSLLRAEALGSYLAQNSRARQSRHSPLRRSAPVFEVPCASWMDPVL
jgi:hypothetical protein